MWVFIEQIGDLYVGVAHDEDGRELLDVTQPVTYSDIHALMEPLSGGDRYDFDNAVYEAETRPRDGRTPERKFFHLLRVRAKAGLASGSDGDWVVDQLSDPDSLHAIISLLWTLGYLGPQHESVVSPFLDHAGTNGEAEYAMRALFQMGLLEKYVDRFVEWMRGSPPPKRRLGSSVYGMAAHAFRQSQNPKILRTLIDASSDSLETWTTREHARSCLAHAVDLENAPLGRRIDGEDPYYAGVIEKARTRLEELDRREQTVPDDEWQWDETLFAGTAAYYVRGRLPYATAMPQALADALGLDGSGRLIDVGCGPGVIALQLAHLFADVVGVDPDAGMLAEAEREAARASVTNARWVKLRAEELPGDLGMFRVATFSRSFHWMDRDAVAAIMLRMLEPDERGAFVQVSFQDDAPAITTGMPHPLPPVEAISELVRSYLGPDRRAGQGIRNSSPGGETIVLERAGFQPPRIVRLPSDAVLERSADDQVAHVFSQSRYAPHLFGPRQAEFETDLRKLLAQASPSGLFSESSIATELRIWRTPSA